MAIRGRANRCSPASGHSSERPFSLFEDLEYLAETIERVQARLVIVDAVMKLLGNKDTYRANEVMAALDPLQMLLSKKGASGLLLRHLNKGSGGMNWLYRGQGSMAFVGMARTAMMVVPDPYDPDKSVLLQTKSNASKCGSQLSFSVQDDEEQGESSPHVCWHGECHYSDAELNGASSRTAAGSCDTHKPNTARDEILRVLEEHAPEALSPMDVSNELPDISLNNIRVTLTRLVKDGLIEQPSRGMYGVTA